MERKEQKCPLCGEIAKYEFFHEPYTKHIECLVCVEFCIDEQAEDFFNKTTDEHRKDASNKAKQSNSERLFIIRAPTDAELKANNKTVVSSELIKRGN